MSRKYYKKGKYNKYNSRNRRGRGSRNRGSNILSELDLLNAIKSNKNTQSDSPKHEINNSFSDFGFGKALKQNLYNLGYKKPTPIQDQAIPEILKGKDIIGIANTGTGKTAAFLLPLIDKTSKDRKQKVLIITPTRELAEQIEKEFRGLAKGMGLYSALIMGGKKSFHQIKSLQRNPNFVIGTPGRLKDLAQREHLNLGSFNNVVLDEADRMVDIGFINEIKYFISKLSKDRQSLFISATVPAKVKSILQSFINEANATTISVAKQVTTKTIKQEIVRVDKTESKLNKLHDLLIEKGVEKTIVFGNTKSTIDYITKELRNRGFSADCIHGDKRQSQRRRVLNTFKENRIDILLATNVAARGLDIDNVSHVINYDLPESYDEYVHRIGRTGRAGNTGTAITLVKR